jgi:hypothetical protein
LDLALGETIVLRGAGQALQVMVVFYSYIKTEYPGCEIKSFQFKNNIIENRSTGRKNKKTLMSFIVTRNYWEASVETSEEGDYADGEEEGEDTVEGEDEESETADV